MPAPPELGDAAGNVGVIEVFHKLKAQNFTKADGHIAVAGKIEKQLQIYYDVVQDGKDEIQKSLEALNQE